MQSFVVNLTPKTFNTVIRKNQYALITFCEPSIGPCKAFMPEFAEAAKELEKYKPKIVPQKHEVGLFGLAQKLV